MKLTERIHVVGSGWLGFGLSHDLDCHVYLVNGGTELALIDAGAGLEVERIVANIRADGLDPGRLKYVLLTHAHSDHAGGCKFWKDRYGARVFGSPETAKFVTRGMRRASASPWLKPEDSIRRIIISRRVRWKANYVKAILSESATASFV